MALSGGFYLDSALTSLVSSTNRVQALQEADGSTPPVITQVWAGSLVSNKKFQAESNPGVDNIVIEVYDAASGSGEPASAVKLATTLLGLDSATPGASLIVGPEILTGVSNAFTFFIQQDDSVGVVGSYLDLKLRTNDLIEIAV